MSRKLFLWIIKRKRKTLRRVRDYPFRMHAKFSEKLTFLTLLIRTRTCAYQGVRNVRFSQNFAYVINGCLLIKTIIINVVFWNLLFVKGIYSWCCSRNEILKNCDVSIVAPICTSAAVHFWNSSHKIILNNSTKKANNNKRNSDKNNQIAGNVMQDIWDKISKSEDSTLNLNFYFIFF